MFPKLHNMFSRNRHVSFPFRKRLKATLPDNTVIKYEAQEQSQSFHEKKMFFPFEKCVSGCLFLTPALLSLQTNSSNWVLWGSELPWVLCCGYLIGCAIHKWTTANCTELVAETSELCLSTYPKEWMAIFTQIVNFHHFSCAFKFCVHGNYVYLSKFFIFIQL